MTLTGVVIALCVVVTALAAGCARLAYEVHRNLRLLQRLTEIVRLLQDDFDAHVDETAEVAGGTAHS